MTDFLPKFNIHKENDFSEKNTNSIPLGNNNISIEKQIQKEDGQNNKNTMCFYNIYFSKCIFSS